MPNHRSMALAVTLLTLHAAGTATPAAAAETWEGHWAKTRKECRDRDGPDSKTTIDLRNVENGKSAPLYDQYENHCRIDSHVTKGNVTKLKLTCFEFWDHYRAKKSPRRDTAVVTTTHPDAIRINGASYLRCR